jgi:lipopolysaccharide/colanic/teichoic acid biosynthesis glycosyltransferase
MPVDVDQGRLTGSRRSSVPASTRAPADRVYEHQFKRLVDVVFTLLALPFFLPIALLIALLIKVDSPGPVLVKLKRLGKSRSAFFKYKFRTMVPDAEKILQELLASNDEIREEYQNTYKIRKDPRITRFGRLLRRTSLDELPQILNVIRGDMSWVGPRDILDSELDMYGEFADQFVTVKPGITGLWQVSGRSKLPYSERVRLDLYYIEHASFLLDLRILFKTVPVVLFGSGAV